MAGFNEAVLTTKGLALLAKAQGGLTTITLTKAATGDGSYSPGEDITQRTALKNQKQEFSLNTVTVQNETNVYVKFIITNYKSEHEYLTQGYYIKEIGIFATDPDEGEILYAIATAKENEWDYLPSYDSLLPSTITVDMMIEVTNADSVTIEMPNRMYLYDNNTGDKYELGIENGLMYYEEVTE